MVTVEKAAMKLRMSPQKMSMRVLAKRKGPRKPKSALLMKVKTVSAMKMKHVRSAEMMICRPVSVGAKGASKSARHGDAAAAAARRRLLLHVGRRGRRGARLTVAIRVV
eukprot:scaffold106786_cov63-Phaeocystis_antarctica.AAC.6